MFKIAWCLRGIAGRATRPTSADSFDRAVLVTPPPRRKGNNACICDALASSAEEGVALGSEGMGDAIGGRSTPQTCQETRLSTGQPYEIITEGPGRNRSGTYTKRGCRRHIG